MEARGVDFLPRTLEDIFRDYKGRWTALVKALTIEDEKFYCLCRPEEANLCLYGYPDERWELCLPSEELPTDLPEPCLGINFARDRMDPDEWISLVSVHSDSWLLAVAFYNAACCGFNRERREELFDMINSLPSLYQIVTGKNCRAQHMRSQDITPSPREEMETEENKEENNEEENTMCASCGVKDGDDDEDEFWIYCNNCEHWFHGKCVKITPGRAQCIKQYKCPSCRSNNRPKV